MMRVVLLTVCAVAMPILDSVPAASGDRDSVGFFQMRVGSTAGKSRKLTAKRKTVGDDSQHLNFKMQEKMGQRSKARTIQSGVAQKQDDTKKGMVKKVK